MAAHHTSPFFALLLFYALFPIVRTYQPLKCLDYAMYPLLDDCRDAVNMVPSGSLDFSGEGGLSWTIEAKAHKYRSLPAKFTYRTCSIDIALKSYPHANPQPAKSIARAIYFHVWPAVKTAAERLVQQCVVRNQSGITYALATINEKDFLFGVSMGSSSRYYHWRKIGYFHNYVGGQEPAPPQAKKPRWKGFKGCLGCSATVTKE
jgi:hypothetical protein